MRHWRQGRVTLPFMTASPSLFIIQSVLGVLRHVALGWSVGLLIAHFPFTPSRWKKGAVMELSDNSWRHWRSLYGCADPGIKPLMKRNCRMLFCLWLAGLWVSLDLWVINRFSPVSLTVGSLPVLPLLGFMVLPFSLWFGTREMHEQLSHWGFLVEENRSSEIEQAFCDDQRKALDKKTLKAPPAQAPVRRL